MPGLPPAGWLTEGHHGSDPAPPRRRRRLEHRHRRPVASRASSSSTRPCGRSWPRTPTHTVTVVVDATFGHRIDKAEVARRSTRRSTPTSSCRRPAGAIGRGDAFVLADRRQGRRDGPVQRLLPGVPRRVRLAVRRGPPHRRQAGARTSAGCSCCAARCAGRPAAGRCAARRRTSRAERPWREEGRQSPVTGGLRSHARAEGAASQQAEGRSEDAAAPRRRSIRRGRSQTRSTRCCRSSSSSRTIRSARPSMRPSSRSRRTARTRRPSPCAATSRFVTSASPHLAALVRCSRSVRRCRSQSSPSRPVAGASISRCPASSPMVSCRPRLRPAAGKTAATKKAAAKKATVKKAAAKKAAAPKKAAEKAAEKAAAKPERLEKPDKPDKAEKPDDVAGEEGRGEEGDGEEGRDQEGAGREGRGEEGRREEVGGEEGRSLSLRSTGRSSG